MVPVLLVSPSAKPGGAERALVDLARLLPDLGFLPTCVLLEPGPLQGWLRPLGRPVPIVRAGRLREPWNLVRAVAGLARLARRVGARAVLSGHTRGHVYGGLAARLARIPAIWWEHDILEPAGIARLARRVPAAAIVCPGLPGQEAARRFTRHRNVVRVPCGIDVEAVAARRGEGAAIRRSLGWEDATVVGLVGRVEPRKGQHLFVEAAAHVAAARPEARFLVVGGAVLGTEGDYPKRVRDAVRATGIGDRVHFTDHVDDPYPWIDAMDVSVSASLREPFGLVVLESMALGVPVVAPSYGGPAELVQDGTSGVIYPAGRADGMAESILRVLDDRQLLSRLAEGGIRRVGEFTDRRMAEGIAAVLRDATE